jgi:hypothetical protein
MEVGGVSVAQDANEVGKARMEGLELGDELGLPVRAQGELKLGEALGLASGDERECDLKGRGDALTIPAGTTSIKLSRNFATLVVFSNSRARTSGRNSDWKNSNTFTVVSSSARERS